MSVPHLITERSLTFFVNSTPYQVDRDAQQFADIVAELNRANPDSAKLVELADLSRKVMAQFTARVEATGHKSAVQYLTKGHIAVSREGVTFNGEVIQNALAERLMSVLDAGLNLGPWVAFAENVYQNPAEYSRDELMLWLDKADLPITSDGCFLAYKVVRDDFKDVHSGRFDNSPGKLVALAGRQAVDPERAKTCSYGLHFCSKDYLPHFGSNSSGRKIVLVKVNPADVVSIPSDYDNTKGRCWRYEVIEEIPAVEIDGQEWKPVANSWSNDYDDYDIDSDYDDDDDDIGFDGDDEVDEDEVYDRTYDDTIRSLDGKGIVELRPLAAALKKGNSTWIWREAGVTGLKDFLAEQAAERAVAALA
jgi:hypothetical protein